MTDRDDLAALRTRLSSMPSGRSAWRSLDAIADTPAFRRMLAREYPAVSELAAGPDRRRFLKLMAASLALSGLAGGYARADDRDWEVPFVNQPERAEPGADLSFASLALIDGYANGILVTTRDGRPFKIEGNPQHPWSRGGTDVLGQASVLGLYDPQRSAAVRFRDRPSSWDAFRGAMTGQFAALKADQGRGLSLLTGPLSSPSLLSQIAAMRRIFPAMRWHSHAPIDRGNLYEGTGRTFGRALETRWRFARARVIVSLDGDFLDLGVGQVGVARDWVDARRASIASGVLLELHAAHALPNLTGAKADHYLAAAPDDIAALATALLDDLAGPPAAASPDASPLSLWRARAAAALRAAPGASLVIAGSTQPPEVQEAVHRLNHALGNIDRTVFYTDPVVTAAEPLGSLAAAITAGETRALLMLDVNPAYDAPGALGFAELLPKVALKIHAGLYQDETADRSDWHLPLSHPLEAWSDARSLDGTVGLMQPTIAPLYGSRSMAEILSLLCDAEPRGGSVLLQEFWRKAETAELFAPRWQTMLNDGFVADTAFAPLPVTLQAAAANGPPALPHDGLDVLLRPDSTVWDGTVANNAWLQELPKPLTKTVWENVISVSPALAERLRLSQGDRVEVNANQSTVEGAVWILPGQSDATLGLTLGYGRQVPDMLFDGLGYDAYRLRGGADAWRLRGAALRKIGRKVELATTQDHSTMEGHDFVRVQTIGAAPVGDPAGAIQPTLYGARSGGGSEDGRAWGMVIDLDSCIGCNACVTACQSENNIAVVGPEQVALGREMHWLRVDRYYEGGLDAPRTHFQPVPCMHCEQAPCEVGCPVEATLHDHEGLNLMVYNRCVGTRACSGYCPYKVRRFNYLDYSGGVAPSLALQRNPEVTVRARGVMEKCTYCVQRIAAARIESDRSDAPIPDGRVQTACQGACPTRAISFGDLNDPASAVASLRQDPRNYALLGDLNTRPRTTYLAEMAPPGDGSG